MSKFWLWYKLTTTVGWIFFGILVSGILTGFQNADELEDLLKDYQ